MFGDRCVDDPPGAELLQQALGHLVGALIFRNLLAHHEHSGIAPHLLRHRIAQRVAHLVVTISVPSGTSGSGNACCGGSALAGFGDAGARASAAGDFAAVAGADAASGDFGGAAGAALTAEASSPSARMTAIGVLTATSSVPSGTKILPSVPSSTASTSIVALSVSISAITSPDLTLSPSCLIHLARLPFSMVGDRAGIRTSIGIFPS